MHPKYHSIVGKNAVIAAACTLNQLPILCHCTGTLEVFVLPKPYSDWTVTLMENMASCKYPKQYLLVITFEIVLCLIQLQHCMKLKQAVYIRDTHLFSVGALLQVWIFKFNSELKSLSLTLNLLIMYMWKMKVKPSSIWTYNHTQVL